MRFAPINSNQRCKPNKFAPKMREKSGKTLTLVLASMRLKICHKPKRLDTLYCVPKNSASPRAIGVAWYWVKVPRSGIKSRCKARCDTCQVLGYKSYTVTFTGRFKRVLGTTLSSIACALPTENCSGMLRLMFRLRLRLEAKPSKALTSTAIATTK